MEKNRAGVPQGICQGSRECGTDFSGLLDSPHIHALEECHLSMKHTVEDSRIVKKITEQFPRLVVLLSCCRVVKFHLRRFGMQ